MLFFFFVLVRVWRLLGVELGCGGWDFVDLDGDGDYEIVMILLVVFGFLWQVFDGEFFEFLLFFIFLFRIGFDQQSLMLLDVVQFDQDVQFEVVMVLDLEIWVYDGMSYDQEVSFDVGLKLIVFVVVDVDDDGEVEIVVVDDYDLFFYDLVIGQCEFMKYGFGGIVFFVGQIDFDGLFEIGVIDVVMVSYFFDGVMGVIDWGEMMLLVFKVFLVDLNGDDCDDFLYYLLLMVVFCVFEVLDLCNG